MPTAVLDPFVVWEEDVVDIPVTQAASGRWVTNNVEGDLLYHDGFIYVGSPDDKVYKFVAATGELLWRFDARAGVKSGIAIDEDGEVIFFGTDANGFFAVDTDDGTLVWHWDDEENEAEDFLAVPTVYDKWVIAGSAGGRIFAWDQDDDRLEWVYPDYGDENDIEDAIDGEFAHAGVMLDNEFHVGNDDGTVYVLRGEDGDYRPRTLRPLNQPYLREQECHRSGNIPDGAECDQEEVSTEIVRYKDGVVFGNQASQLYFWPASIGAIDWVYEGRRDILGDIAVEDNLIVFAERGGTVVAIDTENPRKRRNHLNDDDIDFDRMSAEWKETTEQDAEVVAGPIIHDDMAYWIDRQGILYGYTAQTGREKFQFKLWDNECRRCTAKPVVHGSLIFVATADGFLKAIRLPD